MKVILRLSSGSYYKSRGEWTLGPPEAFDFGHVENALEAARRLAVEEAEIVLWFGAPQFDVVLPYRKITWL